FIGDSIDQHSIMLLADPGRMCIGLRRSGIRSRFATPAAMVPWLRMSIHYKSSGGILHPASTAQARAPVGHYHGPLASKDQQGRAMSRGYSSRGGGTGPWRRWPSAATDPNTFAVR